jgi:UDP-N-acetylmuramoyl-tripeptide--D-alanyl-D-alanine ligase
VTTDSRAIEPGAWFVALRGERFDGHAFLEEAARAGCAGVVIEGEPPAGWERGCVRVDDTLRALQDLAASVRDAFRGPVVGLTGSVGKTTTRALCTRILSRFARVHETGGNLNNHIGVPLTLLATPEDAEILVIEMGMSAPGEIKRLQEIARPTLRLITNVAEAHLEGVGGIDGVARAKGELFDGAVPGDTICLNMDDARVRALPLPPGVRVLRYGSDPSCDIRWGGASLESERLDVRYIVDTPDGRIAGRLPVPAPHVAWNLAAAFCVALALGQPLRGVEDTIEGYVPVGMRMRVEAGPFGVSVLNDAYNANPASMRAALSAVASLRGRRRVAALGDMLELGQDEASLHRALIEEALALRLDTLALCGPRMGGAARDLGVADDVLVARDPVSLARLLAPHLGPGDVLLLKGSRGMAMERLLLELARLDPQPTPPETPGGSR